MSFNELHYSIQTFSRTNQCLITDCAQIGHLDTLITAHTIQTESLISGMFVADPSCLRASRIYGIDERASTHHPALGTRRPETLV